MINSLNQFGITWTFDKDISLIENSSENPSATAPYTYGTFANGDYWIIGPVNIISIDPESDTIDQDGSWTRNGSMINPSMTWYQGFDSRPRGGSSFYNSDLNVALGVTEASPLEVATGSSLISSISQNAPSTIPQLRTAAVLTVLESAPPANSFRPAMVGFNKTIRFNVSDLDYTVLQKIDSIASAPSLSTVERWFQRPWVEVQFGWWASHLFPSDNMEDYGRDISKQTSKAALLLNFDYSDEEKSTLLIRYVQAGIDLYGIVENGPIYAWSADGGIYIGRKIVILVTSAVLHDEDMQAIFSRTGAYLHEGVDQDGYPVTFGPGYDPPDYLHFQEDDQVYYVTKFNVDITNNSTTSNKPDGNPWPTWEPDPLSSLIIPYATADIGLPEWSIRNAANPWKSGNSPTFTYPRYRPGNGCSYPAIALAIHIMDLKELWNHPAFFDYTDRYVRMIEDIDGIWGIKNDPAEPDWQNIGLWQGGTYGVGTFIRDLWITYRADYGISWPHTIITEYSKGTNFSSNTDNELKTIYSRYPISIDNTYGVSLTSAKNYAVFLFKNKHTEKNKISIQCRLKSNWTPLYSTVYLQIFNRITTSWETIDSNNTKNADRNFILSGIITTNLNRYFDNNYWISCRIYQMFM